jgi:hypothetical protein
MTVSGCLALCFTLPGGATLRPETGPATPRLDGISVLQLFHEMTSDKGIERKYEQYRLEVLFASMPI